MDELYYISTTWQEIVDWFLLQPVYAQVLVLIGVFAVLTLAVILVYYILKGVGYLVYYILKGVYYLLKGIGLLFYKIFEGLYYAISGKTKPEKNEDNLASQNLGYDWPKTVLQPHSGPYFRSILFV